ncbi:MAG: flagellar motor switch protein FliG [Dehalococcoidia bacterium]
MTPPGTPLFGGTGRKRAAALLVALGPELGAEILSRLSDDDISQLTWETLGIGQLTGNQREDVLSDFYADMLGGNAASAGGVEYALDMLKRTIGEDRAREMITGMGSTSGARPFMYLSQLDERDALAAIQSEPPQALAVIFSYLPPATASTLLRGLPAELQADVIVRIARIDRAAPDIVEQIDALLRGRISAALYGRNEERVDAGGVEALVEILRQLDPVTERGITNRIEQASSKIGEEIRKRMFIFDDIVLLDDRSVQRVLREIATKDLAIALKGAPDEVAMHILSNMSERASAMVKDDMEALGPIRVRSVEEARSRIVTTIRQLEQDEEIFVQRGSDDLVA